MRVWGGKLWLAGHMRREKRSDPSSSRANVAAASGRTDGGGAAVNLSVSCQIAVTHTSSQASIHTGHPPPRPPIPNFQALHALNAHVLIADGHVRSQVEPLKMWPGGKGHPLMSKSFFTPFVGREGARKCAH